MKPLGPLRGIWGKSSLTEGVYELHLTTKKKNKKQSLLDKFSRFWDIMLLNFGIQV